MLAGINVVRTSAVLVTLALSVSVTSHAAETSPRRIDDQERARLTQEFRRAPEGRPSSDLPAPFDRLEDRLTRPVSQGGLGMIPLGPSTANGEVTDVAADWGFPLPTGDLDGDGLIDLLTYEAVGWDTRSIVARAGSTGAEIWRADTAHRNALVSTSSFQWTRSWTFLDDLNSDGFIDPLFVSVSASSSGGATLGIEQVIEAYDGETGAKRWTWEQVGHMVRGSNNTTQAEFEASTGILAAVDLAADATGDGVPDLMVSTCDSMKTVSPITIYPTSNNGCTVAHLDGITGRVARSFVISPESEPWSVDDLDGDGLSDVVVVWSVATWWLRLDARTAAGAQLWSADAPHYQYAWLETAELRPGANDLILHGWTYDDEAWTLTKAGVHALDANTGVLGWSRALRAGDSITFGDDIDGDGAGDILVLQAGTQAATVTAYDGATFRRRLWTHTMPVDLPYGMTMHAGGFGLGDVTGDTISDLVLTPFAASESEWFGLGGRAIDGATGAGLWSTDSSVVAPYPVWGDMDGNDTPDLSRPVRAGTDIAIEIVDGLTLAHVWTTAAMASDADWGYGRAADLSGEHAGPELLASWGGYGEAVVSAETPSGRLWGLRFVGSPG